MRFFRDNRVSSVLEYPKRFAGQALLMYSIYTAVLGSGILLRSTSCIHAVVRAVLPCSHEKITIFRGVH